MAERQGATSGCAWNMKHSHPLYFFLVYACADTVMKWIPLRILISLLFIVCCTVHVDLLILKKYSRPAEESFCNLAAVGLKQLKDIQPVLFLHFLTDIQRNQFLQRKTTKLPWFFNSFQRGNWGFKTSQVILKTNLLKIIFLYKFNLYFTLFI